MCWLVDQWLSGSAVLECLERSMQRFRWCVEGGRGEGRWRVANGACQDRGWLSNRYLIGFTTCSRRLKPHSAQPSTFSLFQRSVLHPRCTCLLITEAATFVLSLKCKIYLFLKLGSDRIHMLLKVVSSIDDRDVTKSLQVESPA